jgi:hypothetical protein
MREYAFAILVLGAFAPCALLELAPAALDAATAEAVQPAPRLGSSGGETLLSAQGARRSCGRPLTLR